jgi:hypothetical protein
MTKLSALAFSGTLATALAGTALAAAPKTHQMDVALPDGSVAHIEYVGNIAPKVRIAQPSFANAAAAPFPMSLPSFAGFDRMIADMQRQTQQMIRQAQALARTPKSGASDHTAAYGAPANGDTTTIISVSDGHGTCTRTTHVVGEGNGKAPKVTSSVSGKCDGAAEPSRGPANPA